MHFFTILKLLLFPSFYASSSKIPFACIIASEQGQTTHWGQTFDVNRKALSLCPFGASLKKNLLKSGFIHIFSSFIHIYSPGAGAGAGAGQTTFWVQFFLHQHKPFLTLVGQRIIAIQAHLVSLWLRLTIS